MNTRQVRKYLNARDRTIFWQEDSILICNSILWMVVPFGYLFPTKFNDSFHIEKKRRSWVNRGLDVRQPLINGSSLIVTREGLDTEDASPARREWGKESKKWDEELRQFIINRYLRIPCSASLHEGALLHCLIARFIRSDASIVFERKGVISISLNLWIRQQSLFASFQLNKKKKLFGNRL